MSSHALTYQVHRHLRVEVLKERAHKILKGGERASSMLAVLVGVEGASTREVLLLFTLKTGSSVRYAALLSRQGFAVSDAGRSNLPKVF